MILCLLTLSLSAIWPGLRFLLLFPKDSVRFQVYTLLPMFSWPEIYFPLTFFLMNLYSFSKSLLNFKLCRKLIKLILHLLYSLEQLTTFPSCKQHALLFFSLQRPVKSSHSHQQRRQMTTFLHSREETKFDLKISIYRWGTCERNGIVSLK